MRQYKHWILLILLCQTFILSSQVQKPSVNAPSLPSASAWASAKAVQSASVNLYRGAITQTIPIYTVQEAGLNIPISLSYTASGIRVQEIASEVGLGWSLSSGGSVVRIPQGIADDKDNGWYYDSHNLSTSETFRQAVTNGTKDSQPDIYIVSSPGLGSYKFTFEQMAQTAVPPIKIKTIPRSFIKIYPKFNTCGTLVGFHIVGEDGTNYWFGVDSDYIQSTCIGSSNEFVFQKNKFAYYEHFPLEELRDASNRNSIDLQYIDTDYQYPVTIFCDKLLYLDGNFNQQTSDGGCSSTSREFIQVRNKVLDKIITSTTTIEVDHFERADLDAGTISNILGQNTATTPKGIDKIHITEGSTSIVYDFTYGYFIDTEGSGKYKKHLRLSQLQLQSSDGQAEEPPYKFHYYTGTKNNFFPHKETRDIDAFGFYNDANNSTSTNHLIPNTTVKVGGGTVIWSNPSGTTIDRSSDADAQKYGQLVKITWPTQGTTEYEWESNSYKYYNDLLDNPVSIASCTNQGGTACCSSNNFQNIILNDHQINTGYVWLVQELLPNSCPNGSPQTYSIDLTITDLTNNTQIYSKNWTDISSIPVMVRLDTLGMVAGHNFKFYVGASRSKGDLDLYHAAGYTTKVCGGLRIKKITRKDNNLYTPDHIMTYTYPDVVNTGQSSGRIFQSPKFGFNVHGRNALFRSNSLLPLTGYDGSHIGYDRVLVHYNGSGTMEHRFYTDFSGIMPDPHYPPEPPQYKPKVGVDYESHVRTSNNTEIQYTDTKHELHTANSYGLLGTPYTVENLSDFSGYNFSNYEYPYNIYTIRSNIMRPIRVITTLDDVIDTTLLAYEVSDTMVFSPIKITTSNSDGTVYENHTRYTSQYIGGIDTALSNRNMISIPYASFTLVNGDTIAGSQIVFDHYKTTGFLGQDTGSDPFPHYFKQYQRTWNNGVLQPGQWSTELTIESYNSFGQIKQSRSKGWLSRSNTYNADKLLATQSFNGFTTTFEYYPNSRLLNKITAVDGTTTTATYDALLRPSSITNDCNGATTTWSYQLATAPTTFSYTTTTQTYPADVSGRSDLIQLSSRQYLDGLGTPIETVLIGQAPNGRDIIQAVQLDKHRRPQYAFEPFVSIYNGGTYISPSVTFQHRETSYELSPLGRPISTTHTDFNYPSTTSYSYNTAADGVADPLTSYLYPPKSLSKITSIDGNGNRSISFVDRKGNTILSRRTDSNGSNPIDNYTHYDLKHRPTVVFPSGASASTTDLNYYYQYDIEGHVIAKKIPGRDTINYWYNDRDMMAAMQDGTLSAQGQYYVYDFDTNGREIKSGFTSTAPATSGTFANLTPSVALTQNIYGTTSFTKDKLVSSKDRILGTSNWLSSTTTAFSACGQPLTIQSNNHLDLSAKDITQITYDGAFNPVSTSFNHHSPMRNVITDLVQSYDDKGRPDSTIFGIDGAYTTINTTSFNHKEELSSHRVGISASGALLEEDYTYRPVGFMTDITSNLYNYHLRYDMAYPSASVPIRKNGDIINSVWQTTGENKRVYKYQYDYLNRLTNADYLELQSNNLAINAGLYTVSYLYDDRGNITNLLRYGRLLQQTTSTIIDNLSLNYVANTNQLSHVIDTAPGVAGRTEGFKRKAGGSFKYSYDGNGNTARDSMKGITYTYNHLDIVSQVLWDDGRKMVFQYDGSGTLLNKKAYLANQTLIEDRNYVGQIEYLNGDIESIYHPEGRAYNGVFNPDYVYVTDSVYGKLDIQGQAIYSDAGLIQSTGQTEVDFGFVNDTELMPGFKTDQGAVFSVDPTPLGIGTWKYEYIITDHLGNMRMMFSDLNNNGSINNDEILQTEHYYPFGLRQKGNWSKRPSPLSYQYNGIEYLERFELNINMASYRWLDPTIGRWGGVDPKAESFYGLSPYNSMFNNPISFADPEGDLPFLAIVGIGAAIGAISGGINNGWEGAWKGALVGAVGGTLGQFGGGSLIGNIAWGAAEGGITGGLNSALYGGNFFDGALEGAKWGATFAAGTSGIEAVGNTIDGHGFRLDDGVIKNYAKKGQYQDAIDFVQNKFGLDGVTFKYDSKLTEAYGVTPPVGADLVYIGPSAFDSPDLLKATMVHEYGHALLDKVKTASGGFSHWAYPSTGTTTLSIDGPLGYAQEIYSSSKMKIGLKALNTDNPLWNQWSNSLGGGSKWKYVMPTRFNNKVKLKWY